jgi:hypothetical protein
MNMSTSKEVTISNADHRRLRIAMTVTVGEPAGDASEISFAVLIERDPKATLLQLQERAMLRAAEALKNAATGLAPSP